MNKRPLLIVGIDPGTTLGYAIIDFKGNIVDIGSSRILSSDKFIKKVIDIGKPVLVSTDKKEVPGYIGNFSRRTGAKIISPDYDLKSTEKRQLAHGYKYSDLHQLDALASALFALKSVKHILVKIDDSLESSKETLKAYLIECVLLREKSINDTINELTKKEEKVRIVEKKVEINNMPNYLKNYYDRLNRYETESRLMKSMIRSLEMKIKNLEDEKRYLKIKNENIEYGSKNNKLIRFKEKREFNFFKEVEYKNNQIKDMHNEILRLNFAISNSRDKVIIKKLKNFGTLEYQRANKIMNIRQGDIVMVEDPYVVSQNVIDIAIKENWVIVSDKKIPSRSQFIILDKNKINMIETRFFALAEKKEIEKMIDAKSLLNRIIEDYKMSRI